MLEMAEDSGCISKSVSSIDCHRPKPVAHVKPIMHSNTTTLCNKNNNITTSTTGTLKLTKSRQQQQGTLKAKKCRFYRNGDKFFRGAWVVINTERYRTMDIVVEEITRALLGTGCVLIPNGVRAIYALADGHKILSSEDLKDGEDYVCAGPGETFRKVDYGQIGPASWRTGTGKRPTITTRTLNNVNQSLESGIHPKLVLFVRNGTRPRKIVRVLLNKKNCPSFDVALSHITECIKLDSGAVRKIFTLEGKQQVLNLQELFMKNAVFLAYGSERHNRDDFELDLEEYRSLQTLNKATGRRGLNFLSKSNKPPRKRFGSEEQLSSSGRFSPIIRGSPKNKGRQVPKPKMPIKTKKLAPNCEIENELCSDITIPVEVAKEYAVGIMIGEGNFAVVRECVHRQTAKQYALKIIAKDQCKAKEAMIANEVGILRKVNHANIVHLYAEFDYINELYLVMELVKGGDLFDAIAASSKFNERDASTMIRHLCSALSYLHSHRIVHRDIKPENLLVDFDPAGNRVLKLADFGLAQEVTVPLYMVCGTPTYVAPEILAETGYGLKVDIWAAGVILYILLCGFPPFVTQDNDQEKLFDLILSGIFEFPSPYWDDISDIARELVASMLQVDHELRFTAEDVLDHPWLTDCYSDDEASLQLYHKLGVHFPDEPTSN